MRNLFRFVLILSAVSFMNWSCQSTKSAAGAKMLKFNFEKGKSYDYQMTMSMDQEVKGQTIRMDMDTYYSMYVTDDADQIKSIRTRYDRFKMNMDAGPMSLNVDTDKPFAADTASGFNPLAMINKLFSGIKGRDFVVKTNAEGHVVEVSGMKEMFEALFDSMGISGEMKEQARAQFNAQFSEKKLASQFERFYSILPGKEVKTGDSWEKEMEGSNDMTFHSKYTVDEIEGDMVTLKEDSQVDMPGKINGNMSGTLVVDSRSGLIVKADQELKAKGQMGNDVHLKIQIRGKEN